MASATPDVYGYGGNGGPAT